MKRLSVIIGCLLLFTGGAFGQIYRVYRPTPEGKQATATEVKTPVTRWSVEVAAVDSFGKIKDLEGNTLAKQLMGGRGSFWWRAWEPVWIGVEVEEGHAMDQQAKKLEKIRYRHYAGQVKWILTPDTEPKVYMLAGIGEREYKSRLKWRQDCLDEKSMIYSIGLGGEIKLYKGILLTGAYHWIYDKQRWSKFVLKGPRNRHELSIGLQYRF